MILEIMNFHPCVFGIVFTQGALTNSEDPDEMPHFTRVCTYQGQILPVICNLFEHNLFFVLVRILKIQGGVT